MALNQLERLLAERIGDRLDYRAGPALAMAALDCGFYSDDLAALAWETKLVQPTELGDRCDEILQSAGVILPTREQARRTMRAVWAQRALDGEASFQQACFELLELFQEFESSAPVRVAGPNYAAFGIEAIASWYYQCDDDLPSEMMVRLTSQMKAELNRLAAQPAEPPNRR